MARRILTATAILVLATAHPALAETLTVYSAAGGDSFLDAGRPGGVGDQIIWHSALERENGTAIGTNAGTCTRLDQAGNHFCEIVIHEDGVGAMSFTGMQRPEPEPSLYVITGGTGTYTGVTGALIATPVENRARFRYDIEFMTEPVE